ncbi:hypothetical protein CGMCC3_g16049 [Colletotrichum fructicola]|nr:uncharacterized protein CGMCC3_g16049 [Colletotrichum fructicola]KAE9567814.1 hypothetical protein CGMCC3_g16049 [Colletotrichum fructicola]
MRVFQALLLLLAAVGLALADPAAETGDMDLFPGAVFEGIAWRGDEALSVRKPATTSPEESAAEKREKSEKGEGFQRVVKRKGDVGREGGKRVEGERLEGQRAKGEGSREGPQRIQGREGIEKIERRGRVTGEPCTSGRGECNTGLGCYGCQGHKTVCQKGPGSGQCCFIEDSRGAICEPMAG